MNHAELFQKITQKKEFSQLPKKDVELAFEKFDKDQYGDEEKVKLTRDLLRKVFSVFTSQKILNIKDRDEDAKSKRILRRPKLNPKFNSNEWILKKHLSTKERLPYYEELYSKLLKDFKKSVTIFDLGAGVNGFSYKYLGNVVKNFSYIGIEAMKQLVDLMNYHFKQEKINGKAIHESLFEIVKIKKYVKQVKGAKVIFLFKTLDSLEMLRRNYSKELLRELVPLVDLVVVSFATRSLVKRTKFKVKRNWIVNFIEENFDMLDDFELGSERYLSFRQAST
ncbi:hypothetical protein GOV13_00825 [Candidatus Pacearchaeota archaeon]|nr:hypothetical protein [Candidatus Pacearchaeota archaeon]